MMEDLERRVTSEHDEDSASDLSPAAGESAGAWRDALATRRTQQQRNADYLLVQRPEPGRPALAEGFAVVRRHHEQRTLRGTELVEASEQLAEQGVRAGDPLVMAIRRQLVVSVTSRLVDE